MNNVFEFGRFILDTAERRLLRDGKPVALTPKVFETLLVLVQNAGHLVEKDALVKRLWPDAVVEEANLARNVWTLRKALDDPDSADSCIETVSKLGYRFVAPVTKRPADTKGIQIERAAAAANVPAAEHKPESPPPPPARSRRVPRFALAFLVVVGVTAAGWKWLGRSAAPAEPAATSARSYTFLTDGRYDDNSAHWTNRGHIYFMRSITNARLETWAMDADGSNQHRANSQIKDFLVGRFSPDERKVVFVREDDNGVYLADADGGHRTALPFGVGKFGNFDWSPDGARLVFHAKNSAGVPEIFLYAIDTGKLTDLTKGLPSSDPVFSSDGSQIAFTTWRDGNPEIYVMNADGSNPRRLTNHPAYDSYPAFSPDGTQVAFQSNREDEHFEIYLQNLNDNRAPIRLTRFGANTGLAAKCWSTDGTQMLVTSNQTGKDQVVLTGVDPFPAVLVLKDETADLSLRSLSADGRLAVYQAKLADKSLELRVTDLEKGRTRKVFSTEPNYPAASGLGASWSPDASLIAFTLRIDGNTEIVTIKPDGSGLKNLTRHPQTDVNPVFTPDGREIVFVRDAYGVSKLYRMDLDGGNQRRVTDKEGYELTPAFSPDGAYLAFAGDRDGKGLDIFQLDWRHPNEERRLVVRRLHDSDPAFSPDGKQIVFAANGDGNQEIYVMNVDGTGLLRLTHSKDVDASPQFSKDGKRILFTSTRNGKSAIYEIQVR